MRALAATVTSTATTPATATATATAASTATVVSLLALLSAVNCSPAAERNNASRTGARPQPRDGSSGAGAVATKARVRHRQPTTPRPPLPPLSPAQAYRYDPARPTAQAISPAEAALRGLLIVDLSDDWAPFLFQDGEPPKPNAYRQTFVDLANERGGGAGGEQMAPEEVSLTATAPPAADSVGHNYLEPFGIPPTLSVLLERIEADFAPERLRCEAEVDVEGLRAFTEIVGFLDRARARRAYDEAQRDAEWFDREARRLDANPEPQSIDGRPAALLGSAGERATAALVALRADPTAKIRLRAERYAHGQQVLRAIRAAQARLQCEGLLSTRSRFLPGAFDLPTHEALARWERKNDIFGWGQLGGETLASLQRPGVELDFDTFKRILAERVADAAAIVEDGSAPSRKSAAAMATETTATAVAVPNLIEAHVGALLTALHVSTPEELEDFLHQHLAAGLTVLRVAFAAPALPPYYTPEPGHSHIELSVQIDRGEVWYDLPFDARGRPIEQPRRHFPHLTLFVRWHGEDIPLCSWRTTIGSWRSELGANGKIYYRYKNSDVGPRLWKDIVAGPVWIPPDSTPVRDLLVRKVLSRSRGPEWVVNTEVMGPGFQSAYGLAMAIHVDAGGFDNQIRTHGSVDYTSIARRFSHGCHRLVNNRAVRMFDFILRRQLFRRIGAVPLDLRRQFMVDGHRYAYHLRTRGYTYELAKPIPVDVTEGRILGRAQRPITGYLRKAGVDYRIVAGSSTSAGNAAPGGESAVDPDPSTGDSAARIDPVPGGENGEGREDEPPQTLGP